MYYGFFGLSRPPFRITPDTDVFFEGGNRGAILEALIYAISQGEGIIKVTGEVGSGKTMLCRMLQTRLPENVDTIYLANPNVSPDEILHAIAFELQLPITKDASRIEVMHTLNDFLLDRHAQRKQVVLFVEESQNMPLATLEEIRLLSNLETNHHKLLQIVLFGQPELDENLRLPEIRQLRERITHSFSLSPFTAADVLPYLTFRLRSAGYRGPDLFGERVVDYISRISAGLTRRVNIIADKALLAAFADGTHNVSIKHVKAAVRDSEFAGAAPPVNKAPITYVILGVLLGGTVSVAALIAFQHWRHNSAAEVTQIASGMMAPGASAQAYQLESAPASAPQPQSEEIRAPQAASARVQAAPVIGRDIETSGTSRASRSDIAAVSESHDTDDVLDERLRKTETWLATTDGGRFTIQLLGSNDTTLLRQELGSIGKYVELDSIFVYRTTANGKPSFTVLFGTYETRTEAIREIEALPEPLQLNRPYYRTVRGVRAELARNGA